MIEPGTKVLVEGTVVGSTVYIGDHVAYFIQLEADPTHGLDIRQSLTLPAERVVVNGWRDDDL